MSILIKGMEMPKRCMVCNFGDALMGKGFCYVSHCKQIEDYFVRNDRPSWCPLIELPPHGRLIDADALIRQMNQKVEETNNVRYAWVDEMDISLADTIIEADNTQNMSAESEGE